MSAKIQGMRDFFDGAWKELRSWGAGIDFLSYEELQNLIDQEHEPAGAELSHGNPC